MLVGNLITLYNVFLSTRYIYTFNLGPREYQVGAVSPWRPRRRRNDVDRRPGGRTTGADCNLCELDCLDYFDHQIYYWPFGYGGWMINKLTIWSTSNFDLSYCKFLLLREYLVSRFHRFVSKRENIKLQSPIFRYNFL